MRYTETAGLEGLSLALLFPDFAWRQFWPFCREDFDSPKLSDILFQFQRTSDYSKAIDSLHRNFRRPFPESSKGSNQKHRVFKRLCGRTLRQLQDHKPLQVLLRTFPPSFEPILLVCIRHAESWLSLVCHSSLDVLVNIWPVPPTQSHIVMQCHKPGTVPQHHHLCASHTHGMHTISFNPAKISSPKSSKTLLFFSCCVK